MISSSELKAVSKSKALPIIIALNSGPLRYGEIGRMLNCGDQSVTTTIAALRKEKIVSQILDDDNSIKYSLTYRGMELLTSFMRV